MSLGSSYKTANCKNPLTNPEEPILNMSEAELIISLHKLGSSSRFLVCGEGTFVDTMSRMTKCENGPRLFPPPKPRSYHLIPLPPESLSYHFLLWLSFPSVASVPFVRLPQPTPALVRLRPCQAPPLPTFTPATVLPIGLFGFLEGSFADLFSQLRRVLSKTQLGWFLIDDESLSKSLWFSQWVQVTINFVPGYLAANLTSPAMSRPVPQFIIWSSGGIYSLWNLTGYFLLLSPLFLSYSHCLDCFSPSHRLFLPTNIWYLSKTQPKHYLSSNIS